MWRINAASTTALLVLAGCASISSTPTDAPGDGLVYYMPKKDIVVSVVKGRDAAKAITTSVTVTASAAYPDLAKQLVLTFNRNLIGRNAMNVGISSTGLLSSSKSTTTSGISEALKNLAGSLGAMSAKTPASPDPKPACADGSHTFIYPAADAQHDACDLRIKITKVAASKSSPVQKAIGTEHSGVFYRQEEAYAVDVVGSASHTSVIVLSPSDAPVRFLPIAKTLFANNEADFGFVDGMPTKYDQNADGELIALFKLPADVLGAYFAAIGKTFDAFKANDTSHADALATNAKLELAKKKYDACIAAIQAKNDEMLQQLECAK